MNATPAVALADGSVFTTSLVAAAGLIVNVPLVAVSCLLPLRLMLKLANVATPPAFAVCVVVPESVPVPVVSVIVTELLGTTRPRRSRFVTVMAGEITTPAMVVVGCCPNVTAFTA